ncbi:hypothetical protein C9J22_13060 [Photobacterium phosphoreum]|uniref:hypothetical protein n=1 Tax=Photobacterium TaxID=657 RepID=UPI000D15B2A1|nr:MULTISPECIES: hypothetical protein [Photobacterium]MCD9525524.1 hypothetical protein [Photobacterium carnosum]PSU69880.1 hypothetical protein C9J22_13060 [Photobacterium phosphoreum]
MSKISIAYIGDKPFKKDTITGSLLIFPQNKPVEVEADIAYMLLQYPKVWVREEYIEQIQTELKVEADDKAQQEIDYQTQLAAEIYAKSMVVELAGQSIDLSKMTSAKLATLIEANDLTIDAKDAQESVDDFRLRVRNAIRG